MYKKFVWMELPVSIYAFRGHDSAWLLEDISLEYGSFKFKKLRKKSHQTNYTGSFSYSHCQERPQV